MKKLSFILLAIVLLSGCTWMGQLADSAGHNTGAYFAGRGSYPVVHAVIKDATIDKMEDRFNKLLADTAAVVVVEPAQSKVFINDLLFIMTADTSDPYALLSDLTFLLSQFGATFEGEGTDKKLTGIQPVPRSLYQNYSYGWKATKRMDQYVLENK